MLCEYCQKREATVHLTRVSDGNVKKLHLCQDCAENSGVDIGAPISITDLLLGLGKHTGITEDKKSAGARVCASCELSLAEFKKRGRLGCPLCYETFRNDLLPLLRSMHHSNKHIGKIPRHVSADIRKEGEIAGLKRKLNEAIVREEFEEAAKLRDSIAQLCDRE